MQSISSKLDKGGAPAFKGPGFGLGKLKRLFSMDNERCFSLGRQLSMEWIIEMVSPMIPTLWHTRDVRFVNRETAEMKLPIDVLGNVTSHMLRWVSCWGWHTAETSSRRSEELLLMARRFNWWKSFKQSRLTWELWSITTVVRAGRDRASCFQFLALLLFITTLVTFLRRRVDQNLQL